MTADARYVLPSTPRRIGPVGVLITVAPNAITNIALPAVLWPLATIGYGRPLRRPLLRPPMIATVPRIGIQRPTGRPKRIYRPSSGAGGNMPQSPDFPDTIYTDMLLAAKLPASRQCSEALANAWWGNGTETDAVLIELAARFYEAGRLEGRREVFDIAWPTVAAITAPSITTPHRGSRR